MRRIKEYFIESEIDFGKYKGHTIKEIYQFVPSYLEWCIENVKYFYIDLEALEALPIPTPMILAPFPFRGVVHWVGNISPDGNYIKWAYSYLSQGNIIREEKFKFSDKVILTINRKKEQIIKDGEEDIDNQYYEDDFDPSYEKYGGYNGYTDDEIDDIFEGDPSLSWNID